MLFYTVCMSAFTLLSSRRQGLAHTTIAHTEYNYILQLLSQVLYLFTFSIASAIDVEPLFSLPFVTVHTLCFLQYEDHRVDQHLWNVREGLASIPASVCQLRHGCKRMSLKRAQVLSLSSVTGPFHPVTSPLRCDVPQHSGYLSSCCHFLSNCAVSSIHIIMIVTFSVLQPALKHVLRAVCTG